MKRDLFSVITFLAFVAATTMTGCRTSPFAPLAPRPPERYEQAAAAIARNDLAALAALSEGADGAAYHAALAAARSQATEPAWKVELLRKAINLYPGPALGHELARALEAAGARVEALDEWTRFLPSASAVEAVRRLAPDPVSGAARLNSAGAHRAALDWLKGSGPGGPRAEFERALALAGLGRPSEALPGFERYLAAYPGDQTATLAYARTLEALGHSEAALKAYRQSGPRGMGRTGLILESLGRKDEAAAAYLRSDDPEHRWIAGLIYESSGKTAEALKVYRQLAAGGHRVRDDAAQRVKRITGENPLPSPPGQGASGAAAGTVSPEIAETIRRAKSLWSQGSAQVLPGESGMNLAGLEMEIAVRRSSPAERLAIAEWYAGKGNLRRAMTIAHGLDVPGAAGRVGRLAYPLIFQDAARTAAQEFKLEPALVMAVIREESFFNPEAVSVSEARGLMQLLPATGRWIGGKLGQPVSDQDLFRPEINIRFGAWYLRYLIDRWEGDPDKAIASYNGGDGNVARWIKNPLYKERVDLPAVLAYPETREYLSKVNSSRAAYVQLYGSDLTGGKEN